MHHDHDPTAAERLATLAELLARGIERLTMQRHGQASASRESKKRQVQPHDCR